MQPHEAAWNPVPSECLSRLFTLWRTGCSSVAQTAVRCCQPAPPLPAWSYSWRGYLIQGMTIRERHDSKEVMYLKLYFLSIQVGSHNVCSIAGSDHQLNEPPELIDTTLVTGIQDPKFDCQHFCTVIFILLQLFVWWNSNSGPCNARNHKVLSNVRHDRIYPNGEFSGLSLRLYID